MPRSSPAFSTPARRTIASAVLLTASTLTACAVGPDYTRPAAPGVRAYTVEPLATTAATAGVVAGGAQRFVSGADIAADWWTLLHSKSLDRLIERALAHNPDLKAAQAALAAAHESALAQRGVYFPSATAGFSASREKQSTVLAPVPNYPVVPNEYQYNLFTPQVSVSYVPDVFGLNRRTVEAARAQEQAVRFQMIATYNTLVDNVVLAAIQEAALQAEVDATRQLVDLDGHMLQILRYQLAKGYAGGLDVAAQESQLAQVTAGLPPLRKALVQQRDLLAVLTGGYPAEARAADITLASLQLPDALPVSLPSKLVEQRPDVLQAAANLHAACAQVGIAEANRLPSVELTASAGSAALAAADLFGSGTGFMGAIGSVSAPLFAGGALMHAERAAKAAYIEAAEQYRSTVLTAFQNVADTLVAIDQDAQSLNAAAAAADAARRTLDITRRQSKDGYANYLALLGAEQADQQARIAVIQAQASRFADTAALFQALGGGWWHDGQLTRNSK